MKHPLIANTALLLVPPLTHIFWRFEKIPYGPRDLCYHNWRSENFKKDQQVWNLYYIDAKIRFSFFSKEKKLFEDISAIFRRKNAFNEKNVLQINDYCWQLLYSCIFIAIYSHLFDSQITKTVTKCDL